MESSNALEGLRQSVRENSANANYYQAALRRTYEPIAFDDLADNLALVSVPATCTTAPRVAIANLVRKGALEQFAEVDGVRYTGTAEELANDEYIDAEADVRFFVQRTEVGGVLLAEIDPVARTEALLVEKAEFREGFLAVLRLCGQEGAFKEAIGATLRSLDNALRIDGRTGLAGLSVSYYTTSLEDVGALAWANGVWKATRAGMQVLG